MKRTIIYLTKIAIFASVFFLCFAISTFAQEKLLSDDLEFLPSEGSPTADSTFGAKFGEMPLYKEGEIIVKFIGDGTDAAAEEEVQGIIDRVRLKNHLSFVDKEKIFKHSYQISKDEKVKLSVKTKAQGFIRHNLYRIKVTQGSVEQTVKAFSSDPDVIYAEPNYVYNALVVHITMDDSGSGGTGLLTKPNDPLYSGQWALNNIGQTGGTPNADINASDAWNITQGRTDIVIGVIDSGIDCNHPDLAQNIWTNLGEIPDNGLDDDHNGYIDDVHGWNFIVDNNQPLDENGHGTHVAGTIAAVGNNSIGVTGVAWTAKLMALKFLDASGEGSAIDAVRAVEYATLIGAQITNNSWGGGGLSQALQDAITEANAKGVLFVAAAGNSANNNDNTPTYPASYSLSNIIAVAATDNNDQLASFSNYGKNSVDLAAPGVSILSTFPTYSVTLDQYKISPGYGIISGTSMATPHVSGVAGLIIAYMHDQGIIGFKGEEVKARLLGSVQQLANLKDFVITGGRLDAQPAFEVDSIPPYSVIDLAVTATTYNSITLTWTALGDDGSSGRAGGYDIRYSTSPIYEANWNQATKVIGELFPQQSGSPETFVVTGGFYPDTDYYFGMKVMDNVGNLSELSNIVSASTQPQNSSAIMMFSGDDQAGPAGSELKNPLTVKVTDAAGNGVIGIPVIFSIISGGNGAALSNLTAITDTDGKASTMLTLSDEIDSNGIREHQVSAVYQGLSGSPVTFTEVGYLPINLIGQTWKSPSLADITYPLSHSVNDAVFDDLDNDGHKEILTQTYDAPYAKLHLFGNSGSNTYSEVWQSDVKDRGGTFMKVLGEDMDGNGKREFIGGQLYGRIWIYENNGNNSFADPVMVQISNPYLYSLRDLKIADTNRNGRKEFIFLMVGDYSQGSQIWMIEHSGIQGSQTYNAPELIYSTMTVLSSIQIGDSDNDDKQEILLGVGPSFIPGDPMRFHRLEYNPTVNTYEHKMLNLSTTGGSSYLRIADIDDDGKNETIIGGGYIEGTGGAKLVILKSPGSDQYNVVYDDSSSMSLDNTVTALEVTSFPGLDYPFIAATTYTGKLHLFSLLGGRYFHLWESRAIGSGKRLKSIKAGDGDNDGCKEFLMASDSDYLYIYEDLGFIKPSVEITNPDNGDVLNGTTTANVTAVGEPSEILFNIDGQPLPADITAPYEFTIDTNILSEGTHAFQASANYPQLSMWVYSEPVSVIVQNNQSPALNYIGKKTVYTNNTLSFFVSATDLDEQSFSLEYSANNLPFGSEFFQASSLFEKKLYKFQWRPTDLQIGFHYITFTVTDSYGAFDSETIIIEVKKKSGGRGSWPYMLSE